MNPLAGMRELPLSRVTVGCAVGYMLENPVYLLLLAFSVTP